jgi:hypothetical protein
VMLQTRLAIVTLNGINILANWRVAKHQPRKA